MRARAPRLMFCVATYKLNDDFGRKLLESFRVPFGIDLGEGKHQSDMCTEAGPWGTLATQKLHARTKTNATRTGGVKQLTHEIEAEPPSKPFQKDSMRFFVLYFCKKSMMPT